MSEPFSIPEAQTWIEMDRKVVVQISAKDLATFLTTEAHLTNVDKKGLAEMVFDSKTDMVTLSFSTKNVTDRQNAGVDLGSVPPAPTAAEGTAVHAPASAHSEVDQT